MLLQYGTIKTNQRSTNRTADIQTYVMLLRDIHDRIGSQRASNFSAMDDKLKFVGPSI